MLSKEMVDFLGGGLSLLVATRNAELMPECGRLVGLRVEPDLAHVTVYLPEATGERVLAGLRDNGRIAIVASLPLDHRSIQMKGRAVAIERAPEADRALIDGCVSRFALMLDALGMPRSNVERLTRWPATAIRVRVEELYQQTPGPGAGTPLKGGAS